MQMDKQDIRMFANVLVVTLGVVSWIALLYTGLYWSEQRN